MTTNGATGPTGCIGIVGATGPSGIGIVGSGAIYYGGTAVNIYGVSDSSYQRFKSENETDKLDKNISIKYSPYNEEDRLSMTGTVREVAWLIMKQVLERKELATYSYNGITFSPTTVIWGPFVFDTKTLEPSIKDLTIEHSEQELNQIENIINEIYRIKKMESFL